PRALRFPGGLAAPPRGRGRKGRRGPCPLLLPESPPLTRESRDFRRTAGVRRLVSRRPQWSLTSRRTPAVRLGAASSGPVEGRAPAGPPRPRPRGHFWIRFITNDRCLSPFLVMKSVGRSPAKA